MNNRSIKVSVVIPTRNRYQSLMHNLGSLLTQSKLPDEVVIIDNGSTDKTGRVSKNLTGLSSVKVKYVKEKKVGYPYIYNRGSKEASNEWVAFLDDDCVACHDWFENILRAIDRFQNAAVILGANRPLEMESSLVLADYFYKQLGLIKVKGNRVLDFEILDSKNIIYRQDFLQNNAIEFDEGLVQKGGGSSEDCDLGMQIQQAEGKAYFSPEIMVYHKEENRIIGYYRKLVQRTRDHQIFEEKWGEERRRLGLTKVQLKEALEFLIGFIKNNKIFCFKLPRFIIHLLLISLIRKGVSLFSHETS